ncbi:hypothetical protein HDU97_003724 [Phlyctochytrium planicorne]|nr:hypothetical protein HDU97_003724 [Phlyctochytrium planicorne]
MSEDAGRQAKVIIGLSFASLAAIIALIFGIRSCAAKRRLRTQRVALAEGRVKSIVTIPTEQLKMGPNGDYIPPKLVYVPPGHYKSFVDYDAHGAKEFGNAASNIIGMV